MSHDLEGCVLCGSETEDRRMQLVEWLEPISRERYSTVPRCLDRERCRERVEYVLGEPWPINDRTLASERPLPPEEPPAPVVGEEDIAWLR